MRAGQEATVKRLWEASRRNRLEFLLEIIPSKVGAGGRRHHRDADPPVLRRRHLARLVEARADDLARRLGERHRRDRGARPPHPRHRRARPRRAGGRARARASRPPPASTWSRASPSAGRSSARWRGAWMTGEHGRRRGGRGDGAALHAALRASGTRRARPRGRRWHEPEGQQGRGPMSGTIRLTAAQAMMRWLSVQMTEDGDALHRGRLGDLRPRQRRRHRRGAARHRRRAPDLARPERADHGARRHRLRQDQAPPPRPRRHLLDRPGLDQHGHRRGARPRQPPAGALHLRRRLRQPPPRPGAAADRGLRRRHRLGQRLLQAGHPLLRPHLPARAPPDRAAPRAAHPDRPGRLRPGLPRLLPGRAGRGLRLPGELLRAARLAHPPPRARPGRGRRRVVAAIRAAKAPGDRRRRRRALLRRRGPARRLRRAPQHPDRRDPGRQGRARAGSTR